MNVSTISAREAKLRFWEFLDTVQRWPTIVTKNNRPVGVMISIEDAKNTLLHDYLLEKEEGYDEYVNKKVSASLAALKSGKNPTIPHDEAMKKIWNEIFVSWKK